MPLSHGVNGAQEASGGGRVGWGGGGGVHKTFQAPTEPTKRPWHPFPFTG